jgi:hypothetical protein
MVNKSATIPKEVVISEGRPVRVSTVPISSKVSELATKLTEASEKEISTTSASATLAKVIEPGKESTEAFEEETRADSPGDRLAGITQAPALDVIQIEDEHKESEKEVRESVKRKGKEKVHESPKRTRFASDPELYALTLASEAELLFGRPRFILPTVSAIQEIPAKFSLPDSSTLAAPNIGEPLSQSTIGDIETLLEPEAALTSGDRMVMEPEDHLESWVADLLDPIKESFDPNLVIDPPRAEELEEPQPEDQNPLPSRGEARTSRQGALIASLREGLLACPLEALLEILPEKSSSMSGTKSSAELAEALLHAQLQVSFMRRK